MNKDEATETAHAADLAGQVERRVVRRFLEQNMKETDVDAWLKRGEYLPEAMRDFHDQKDIFKAIHEIVKEPPDSRERRPTWVEAHIYVVDVFLWFMARRGYTLQRTRRRGNFRDLETDVQTQKELRDAAFTQALGLTPYNA
jgi:hypothetical protein